MAATAGDNHAPRIFWQVASLRPSPHQLEAKLLVHTKGFLHHVVRESIFEESKAATFNAGRLFDEGVGDLGWDEPVLALPDQHGVLWLEALTLAARYRTKNVSHSTSSLDQNRK